MDAELPRKRDAIRTIRRDSLGFLVLRAAWLGNAHVDAGIPRQAGPCDHEGRCELSKTRGRSALGVRRGIEEGAAVGSGERMRGVAISRARC